MNDDFSKDAKPQLCRICLILNCETIPLTALGKDGTSYMDMYISVTKFEVIKFPDAFQICQICAKYLKSFYRFQQKCIDSWFTYEQNKIHGDESIQPSFEVILKAIKDNGNFKEKIDFESEVLLIVESDISDIEERNVKINISTKKKKRTNISNQMLQEEIERIKKLKKICSCVCKFCNLKLGSTTALTNHVNIIHKEFKDIYCVNCNEILNNSDDMESHKVIHKTAKITCKFCKKVMKSTNYLGHLETHLDDKPHVCKFCKRSFARLQYLKSHVKIHLNLRPYKCPNCTGAFVEKKVLDSHVKRHGMFKCEECLMRFKYQKQLNVHNCSESKQKIEEYTGRNAQEMKEIKPVDMGTARKIFGDRVVMKNFCEICKRRVRDIITHTEIVHTNGTCKSEDSSNFTCLICAKTYNTYKKFKCHSWIHQRTGHKCTFCGKNFKSPAHLRIHQRTHNKERPHTCKICKMSFAQSGTLKYHLLQHGERNEVCHLCNKRFCRKADLKLHIEKHEGKRPYLCPECGKSFYQKCHLTSHCQTHKDERPFSCKFCSKTYKFKSVLNSHLKTHVGDQNFACRECSYTCFTKYRLEQHMKQHGNKKSKNESVYFCVICKMAFQYLSLLKLHMTSAHEVVNENDK